MDLKQVNATITPISSHRVYFRERSNPQYVNNNVFKHGTSLYEVGHDPSIGIVFDYTESDNEFWPDQNAHGKMASTMTTQNGKVYNYIEWVSGDFMEIILKIHLMSKNHGTMIG